MGFDYFSCYPFPKKRIMMTISLSGASVFRLSTLAAACFLLTACPRVPAELDPVEEAVFRIEACEGEHFQALIADPEVIQEAEQLIGAQEQRLIIGELRRGNGGFNAPWSWHMDPQTVHFADVTMELCDACPHMVEEGLDYWLDTVGNFCPWTTRVVERVR
jgi:hypothetical protein